eukprot:TRINITY_DN14336_c0_g1_i1.p1 TRINITY_DN14336_c0_g1~~TRINITY_DN14336_c0_g1_i1.p1  ORF type:complete len:598 (-),score=131.53 TRINITY_DN14336_c0_g1_i1:75-1868(-)
MATRLSHDLRVLLAAANRLPSALPSCSIARAQARATAVPARHFAALRHQEQAPAETSFDLLRSIRGDSWTPQASSGDADPATAETAAAAPGVVLAAGAAVARADLPGAVAVGRGVALEDGGRGVVLRFDRKGALVAPIEACRMQSGATATLGGELRVRLPPATVAALKSAENGAACVSVAELIVDSEEDASASAPLLRLPAMPAAARRRPVRRRLPTGLAALEALQPPAEGHRIGFVGTAGTGKSSAARMLLAAQRLPDVACVYAALQPLAQLERQLDSVSSRVVCVHADPVHSAPFARYALPLCALQVARQLQTTHRHVLLVIDDVLASAAAAEELGVTPIPPQQALAAILDAGGRVSQKGGQDDDESVLTVAAVFDLEPHADALTPAIRDLWRSAEGSLDVCVDFAAPGLAAKVPTAAVAIDVEALLSRVGLCAPTYQAPLFKLLRNELLRKLQHGKELEERMELKTQLGLHHDVDEEEEVVSLRTARALLLRHSATATRSSAALAPQADAELAVILCATALFHFPASRPSATSLAGFQAAVVDAIRNGHPALWQSLQAAAADELPGADAAAVLRALGEALLSHRFDFLLTKPEW